MSARPGRPAGNTRLAGTSSGTNHDQMRPATATGSPKKKAAFSLVDNSCQVTRSRTSTASCHARSMRISGGLPQLLGVALEDFIAQHRPDLPVQLHEAWMRADFGDVARTRQVDREFTHRPGGGTC